MNIRQYIKWLYGLSAGQRGRMALRIAAGVVRVGVALTFVWLCKQMVDAAVTSGWSMPLWPYVWALIGCMVVQIGLGAAVSRIGVTTTARATNRLRLRMFEQSMRALYGRSLHSADTVERMRKDTDTVADLVSVAVPDVIVTLVQLAAAFVFLAMLDWRLALVMVAIMPLALLLGKAFLRRMRRLSSRIRQLDSAVNRHVQEHLHHRYVDVAFQAEGRAVTRMERLQMRLLRLIARRNNYSLFSRMMIQAGFMAGYLTAFVWGVYGLASGAVTFGVMTAFLQLVSQVQRPAIELAQKLPGFVYGMASAERIVAVTEAPAEEEVLPTGLP
ncbi:MAG: ABC transporter ATP-binding protein, partial [Paramuribaculum sp.]